MKRLLVCSDAHGCYEDMRDALIKAKYTPSNGDRLIVLGDMIDRGPDSRQCVLYAKELQERFGAVILRGNHEQMAIDTIDDPHYFPNWVYNGGYRTVQSYDPKIIYPLFGDITPELKDHIEWFKTLPLYHEEDGFLFVHAGIRPGVEMEKQVPDDLLWIREEFFDAYYDDQFVVIGHTPIISFKPAWTKPCWSPIRKILFCDTGCVFREHGGKFSVVELNPERPLDLKVYQV